MSSVYIPFGAAGAASFNQDWYVGASDLFFGPNPEPVTQNFPIDATFLAAMVSAASSAGSDVVIPLGYAVGINSSNALVAATVGSGSGHVALLGITAAPVLAAGADTGTADPSGADYSGGGMPVFIQGYFDIDAVTWPAAFTTDTLKLAAARQNDGVRIGSVLLFDKKLYRGIIANPQPSL